MKNVEERSAHEKNVEFALMYLPGGHVTECAVQECVASPLFDGTALKNPGEHVWHLGCAAAEAAVLVYLPAGHLVWAVHRTNVLGQPMHNKFNRCQGAEPQ